MFVCLQITWPRRESPCRVCTIDRRDQNRLLFSIEQKGCVGFFLEIYYYNYYFTLFLEKITGKKHRFANHTGSPREIDLKRKRKYPSLYIWKGSVKEKAIMNVHRSCSFSRSVVSAILDACVFISMVIFGSCNEN